MELQNKPDLDRCLDRIDAWWSGQMLDRPPVTIQVRPDRPARAVPPRQYASLRDRWMDVDRIMETLEAAADVGVYLAETFPKYYPNLGPEVCSTCYGAELEFGETTSWSVPTLSSIRQALTLQPNLASPYWQALRRMASESLRRGAGKWITARTDLHTQGDLLASLRNPQDFALDFADDLEGVRQACRHVTPHFRTFYDDHADAVTAGLCATWGSVVSRRPMYYLSCDFICMISPAMFAETILPAIEWESRQLPDTIFHLDGPGGLAHLPALLALPRLHAIQWVYGAGNGPAARWIDVYRTVQAAGKGVEVVCDGPDDLRTLMDALDPKGLWLVVGGAFSRAEANALLDDIARWARGKR